MASNTMLVILVILSLLTIHFAYRIDPNDEPTQAALFRQYEDGERLANLYNLKQVEDNDSDNYYIIPCHPTSSHILCNKLDHISRRDTGFLRFGRKR